MRWSADKFSILAAALLAALAAPAFDSDAWFAERESHAAAAAALRGQYAKFAAKVATPAENLTVPLENFADGSIKSTIFAKRACFFLKEGYIWGEGVTIRQMKRDGSVESQVDAENCLVNRETRRCWVEGHAKAYYRDQAEIEGDGVYLDAAGEYAIISTNTVMRADGRTLKGVRLDYDRKAEVAMLDGDAVLTGEERGHGYRLDGGKVMAFFASTNNLKRVVAYDGVKVKSENRFGRADRAVYLKGAKKITMYGGEGGKALLEERGTRNSTVSGARITFWMDAEQVEVIDSEITAETKNVRKYGGFDGKQSR
ncbi:MAG: hypothetical protein IKO64_05715 [Kiritimatiellae bacterium]|nr:hypothetical protein [Kiritimatiellia bacterium]